MDLHSSLSLSTSQSRENPEIVWLVLLALYSVQQILCVSNPENSVTTKKGLCYSRIQNQGQARWLSG